MFPCFLFQTAGYTKDKESEFHQISQQQHWTLEGNGVRLAKLAKEISYDLKFHTPSNYQSSIQVE